MKLIKKAVKLILMPAILRKKLNNTTDENTKMLPAVITDKGGANIRKVL
jgi:hypothetical protein